MTFNPHFRVQLAVASAHRSAPGSVGDGRSYRDPIRGFAYAAAGLAMLYIRQRPRNWIEKVVCAIALRIVESGGPVEEWTRLEQHFCLHKALVSRFGSANGPAVIHMWKEGRNEHGETLSSFERAALVERYCQLFGHWPSGYAP